MVPDQELRDAFRCVLMDPPFLGRGIGRSTPDCATATRVSTGSASVRIRAGRGGRWVHDCAITSPLPDPMWGTDAARVLLSDSRQATVSGVCDRCTCGLMSSHAALRADWFEATASLSQATLKVCGRVTQTRGAGVKLRRDTGSPSVSRASQAERRFLGMEPSPSCVRDLEWSDSAMLRHLLSRSGNGDFVMQRNAQRPQPPFNTHRRKPRSHTFSRQVPQEWKWPSMSLMRLGQPQGNVPKG